MKSGKNICKFENCNKYSSYGPKGGKREFCAEHKKENHVDIINRRCKFEGCKTRASFGEEGTKNAEFCKKHKICDYVNITSKRCIFDGCLKFPVYGKKDEPPEYCKLHKLSDDYIYVKSKRCIFDGCLKIPVYGKKGTKTIEYCKLHRPSDNYINVISKRCIFDGCLKIPVYGKKDETPEYCKLHKLSDEYIDIKSKRCIFDGCLRFPVYGKKGTKTREYCSKHRPFLKEYVDLTNKTCLFQDCETIATFGKRNSKFREFCKEHIPSEDYINLATKKCILCFERAYYGFTSSTHCSKCKEKGMLYNPSKRCKNCKERALYGDPLKLEPMRCENHKIENDFNLLEKNCNSCNLPNILNQNGLCMLCSDYKKYSKKVKKYELEMIMFLKNNDIEYISYDKPIDRKCSLRRPDFIIRGDYQNIIIEVDEHQHSRKIYSKDCEISRMREIYMANGERYLTFIRFNPNGYRDKTGKIIQIHKKRYDYLLKYLKEIKTQIPTEHLTCVYLFYDGFESTRPDIEIISPY
jgi:hypothetical protein